MRIHANPASVRAGAVSPLPPAAAGASRERAEPDHPLRNAILSLESRLSRAHGIIEFSNNPDCVLRIAVRQVRSTVVLVDTRLAPGELVADLHYLNGHLPRLGRSALAWGSSFRRRLYKSFEALAAAMETDPRLREVRAVRGRMISPLSRQHFEITRFGAHFGLAPAPQTEPVSLTQRAHELGEDIWFCALAWAYGAQTLRGRGVLRWRGDVWMSRAQLLARYPPRRPAPNGQNSAASAAGLAPGARPPALSDPG